MNWPPPTDFAARDRENGPAFREDPVVAMANAGRGSQRWTRRIAECCLHAGPIPSVPREKNASRGWKVVSPCQKLVVVREKVGSRATILALTDRDVSVSAMSIVVDNPIGSLTGGRGRGAVPLSPCVPRARDAKIPGVTRGGGTWPTP